MTYTSGEVSERSKEPVLKTGVALVVTVGSNPTLSASHPAAQQMQDLFRQKADRLYHWTRDPAIPAENNLTERELRPLVIARRVSFGSQSDRRAATRETLMTVLHTVRKRIPGPAAAFKAALDQLAQTPDADPFMLLFPQTRPKRTKLRPYGVSSFDVEAAANPTYNVALAGARCASMENGAVR